MSATDPNPSNNPEVTGQEAWFNKDVRVYEDLYVMEIYITTLMEMIV